MSLTAAERAELAALNRNLDTEDDVQKGEAHIEQTRVARKPVQTAPPQTATRSFSIYRATVGGLRDAVQGLYDTVHDAEDYIKTKVTGGRSLIQLGSDAENGYIGFGGKGSKATQAAEKKGIAPLEKLDGEDQAGTAEKVVRGITSFAIPFVPASKVAGVAKAATFLGRAGRGLLAGAAVDLSQVDPVSGNMANIAKEFGVLPKTLESLASEDDDEKFEQRMKAALAGAPLGLVGDAVMEVGAKAIRGYRAWKGTFAEADAAVKGANRDMALKPGSRNLPAVANDVFADIPGGKPPKDGGTLNAKGAEDFLKPGPEDAKWSEIPPGAANDNPGAKPKRPYDPATDTGARATEPKEFGDVLDYIKSKIGAHELAGGDVAKFAKNLLTGDPENALAKIGIDPAKLDFSAYDDPDTLGRLQKGMAELYETYAGKLGRSNQRVTEEATTAAARALASTPDTLKALHGSTANLAEELTASRLFVGAHAHKLLGSAEAAMKEITENTAGPAWDAFMENFHRHAYYLGTLRGAGSEVGRALRSLQMLAKAKRPTAGAARNVEDALAKEAAAQAPDAAGGVLEKLGVVKNPGRLSFQEGASTYAARLGTDAEKLEGLQRLIGFGGDVGDLTREVRRGNLSTLARIDEALKETMGNLFGVSTAAYNVLAGGSMLGIRGLEKTMSTMARMALVPFGGKEAGVAARAQLMDTWAYGHGIISGFGEAYNNSLLMLAREGGSELSLNANTLGLDKVAKQMAVMAGDATRAMGEEGNRFIRADTENYRNFAVTPSEMRTLQQMARDMPGPKFFTEGLAALARIGGNVINQAGSLSRLGTILFINLPDQFVGTLAARAGAYSSAVRSAASEAAELGLEGKDLSMYLKARTVQLAEHPVGWSDDGFSDGAREAMANLGEVEAREVLFQDDLELGLTRAMSFGLTRVPMLHFAIPFVKTPLRILERTAIDYTPLGLLKDRVRHAIAAGGPERDEAIARISLGMMATFSAFALADDRTIVGKDGGFTSSARLSRSSYSLKIGDDNYEFSRIDPLGTLLGFGADLRTFYHQIEDDPEHDSMMLDAMEGFLWATTANILSKSWLTSMKNLSELAGSTSNEDMDVRLRAFLGSTATRLVPASGVQRQYEAAGDGFLRQAITYTDNLMKSSIGGDTLPVRRDALLGRPVPLDGLTRVIGVKGGPGADASEDPLGAEVERLSFQIPSAPKKLNGVRLTSSQFSRYLELKGQVVTDPESGLTLEGTLDALVANPGYKALTEKQKVTAMRESMDGFARLAKNQLLREDKGFAYASLRKEIYDQVLNKDGGNRADADKQLGTLAQQLGLQPSE